MTGQTLDAPSQVFTCPDVEAAAAWLAASMARRGAASVRIATLGPEGTSADTVLAQMAGHLRGDYGREVVAVLQPEFDRVMDRVVDGCVDFALLPSAYRDATAFHWHAALSLDCVFVHRTPAYGLAASADVESVDGRPVTVAAMSETRGVYSQVAPAWLHRRPVSFVQARSTSDAASLVRKGEADIALCNDEGRDANGLSWIGVRPGADIVWMLFRKS